MSPRGWLGRVFKDRWGLGSWEEVRGWGGQEGWRSYANMQLCEGHASLGVRAVPAGQGGNGSAGQ